MATATKTVCPISRQDFRAGAKPLTITINGQPMVAGTKEFSTGSLGWFLGDKVNVMVGDVPVKVQLGINLTVVGSKELPE